MHTIQSWSHSGLKVYERCKQWAKLRYIDKLPEKKGPAASRGVDVHDALEHAVKDDKKLPDEAKHFAAEFKELKALYKRGRVKLELERAFDRNWKPVEWKQGWGRAKYDARVLLSKTLLLLTDYKTGKKDGNEVDHAEQGQIYMLSEFMIEPLIEEIVVEFWYLDINDLTRMRYTRDQGLRYFKSINARAEKMTSDTTFEATPSRWACKWCPYRQDRGGPCKVGVIS
jgi:hypothetical protein